MFDWWYVKERIKRGVVVFFFYVIVLGVVHNILGPGLKTIVVSTIVSGGVLMFYSFLRPNTWPDIDDPLVHVKEFSLFTKLLMVSSFFIVCLMGWYFFVK